MKQNTVIVSGAGHLAMVAACALKGICQRKKYVTELVGLVDGRIVLAVTNIADQADPWWRKARGVCKRLIGLQVACCVVFECDENGDLHISVVGVDYLTNLMPLVVSLGVCWWLALTGATGLIRQKLFVSKILEESQLIGKQLLADDALPV